MIQGKQVYLRGLEREDLKLLHEMYNDEEIMEWARSRPDNATSMEELEKEYEGELKGENARRRTFVIVHKATRKVIGWASIRWWRPVTSGPYPSSAVPRPAASDPNVTWPWRHDNFFDYRRRRRLSHYDSFVSSSRRHSGRRIQTRRVDHEIYDLLADTGVLKVNDLSGTEMIGHA